MRFFKQNRKRDNEFLNLRRLDYPAYHIQFFNSCTFIISGGGGEARTGIPNLLEAFTLTLNPASDSASSSPCAVVHNSGQFNTGDCAVMQFDLQSFDRGGFILTAEESELVEYFVEKASHSTTLAAMLSAGGGGLDLERVNDVDLAVSSSPLSSIVRRRRKSETTAVASTTHTDESTSVEEKDKQHVKDEDDNDDDEEAVSSSGGVQTGGAGNDERETNVRQRTRSSCGMFDEDEIDQSQTAEDSAYQQSTGAVQSGISSNTFLIQPVRRLNVVSGALVENESNSRSDGGDGEAASRLKDEKKPTTASANDNDWTINLVQLCRGANASSRVVVAGTKGRIRVFDRFSVTDPCHFKLFGEIKNASLSVHQNGGKAAGGASTAAKRPPNEIFRMAISADAQHLVTVDDRPGGDRARVWSLADSALPLLEELELAIPTQDKYKFRLVHFFGRPFSSTSHSADDAATSNHPSSTNNIPNGNIVQSASSKLYPAVSPTDILIATHQPASLCPPKCSFVSVWLANTLTHTQSNMNTSLSNKESSGRQSSPPSHLYTPLHTHNLGKLFMPCSIATTSQPAPLLALGDSNGAIRVFHLEISPQLQSSLRTQSSPRCKLSQIFSMDRAQKTSITCLSFVPHSSSRIRYQPTQFANHNNSAMMGTATKGATNAITTSVEAARMFEDPPVSLVCCDIEKNVCMYNVCASSRFSNHSSWFVSPSSPASWCCSKLTFAIAMIFLLLLLDRLFSSLLIPSL